MKKTIILILLVGINISIFPQLNPGTSKILVLQGGQLKYFVVPGFKQGESEMMDAIRNKNYNYFQILIPYEKNFTDINSFSHCIILYGCERYPRWTL